MSKSILIIDDEQHIRRMIRITLEAAGYHVGEAADGLEGVKAFGDGSEWDVVVLDQRMPGIDGLETLKQMKQRDPSARVIMATAYASIELAVDAMKLGASDFVRKPMTPELLRNAVSAVLKKPKPAAPRIRPEQEAAAEVTPIQTITMNGFSILDQEQQERAPDQRSFIVVSPDDSKHEVVVQIDEQVLGYVERITRRRLPPQSSFWTQQARQLLAEYLWNEGNVPPSRKLTLTQLNRDKLITAERWKD